MNDRPQDSNRLFVTATLVLSHKRLALPGMTVMLTKIRVKDS